jgi:Skp family chaperone for outer membrane proteins
LKKLIILLAFFSFLILGPTTSCLAQGTGSVARIAVIDINLIIRDALAFNAIREQISKYRKIFQAEIQKEEEALRNANQELARQRTLLSAEAFSEKRKDFEKRVAGVQRLVQQRKQNLDRSQGAAMGKIQKRLNEIVTVFALEQDISLILRKDQTILAAKGLRATKVVLDRLNAAMPTIKVAAPAK